MRVVRRPAKLTEARKGGRVTTVLRIVVGVILIAHGLVHLLYISSDAADPGYPFTLEQSLLPEEIRRPVAHVLVAATVAAFVLLGLAILGTPGLAGAWAPLAMIAAGVSLALLIAFWDTRLLAGVAIDLAIVLIAAAQPEWTDRIAS
jgi:hypothetical protein